MLAVNADLRHVPDGAVVHRPLGAHERRVVHVVLGHLEHDAVCRAGVINLVRAREIVCHGLLQMHVLARFGARDRVLFVQGRGRQHLYRVDRSVVIAEERVEVVVHHGATRVAAGRSRPIWIAWRAITFPGHRHQRLRGAAIRVAHGRDHSAWRGMCSLFEVISCVERGDPPSPEKPDAKRSHIGSRDRLGSLGATARRFFRLFFEWFVGVLMRAEMPIIPLYISD